MEEFNLDNKPKIETGFKTPDHYFEQFSAKIIHQLPEKEPKVISLFQRRIFLIRTLAAILVLAIMIPVLYTLVTKSDKPDEDSLENYLTYEANISQYDLISELETEDIDKMKNNIVVDDQTIENLLDTNSDLQNILTE